MILMTILVAVIMSLKCAALAKAELYQIMPIDQFDGLRVRRDCLQRLFKEGLQFVTYPEHHISRLEHLRLRWLECVIVRRTGTVHNQPRLTNTFHDRSNQRVDRLDRRDHIDLGMSRDCRCGKQR